MSPEAAPVRRAAPADAPAIVALEAGLFGADAWSERLVADGIAGADDWFVLGPADGPVLGYVTIGRAGDDVELHRIAVADAVRRRGCGRALLTAAIEGAQAGGAVRMLLEVREDNEAARAFYARAGFEELGRRPRYYRDGATAVILALDLRARSATLGE